MKAHRLRSLAILLALGALTACVSNTGRNVADPASYELIKLPLPEPMADAKYGVALASAGDRYLVGAPDFKVGKAIVGRAYLFDQSDELAGIIQPAVPEGGAEFGRAVAMNERWLAIAAPQRSHAGDKNVGAVDLFDARTLEFRFSVAPPAPGGQDLFGTTVVLDGDELWVGAIMTPIDGTPIGRVYGFDLSTGELVQQLDDPTPSTADLFGRALLLLEDRIIVSASADHSEARASGQVHVFDRDAGTLLFTISDPDQTRFDLFGEALLLHGDELFVGSPRDNQQEQSQGNVHRFTLTGEHRGVLRPSIRVPNQWFGFPLAAYREFLVVGAPLAAIGKSLQPGRLYLIEKENWTVIGTVEDPEPAEDDSFGAALTVSGDDLLIGSPGDDARDNAGALYRYRLR